MRIVTELLGMFLVLLGAYYGGREILRHWYFKSPSEDIDLSDAPEVKDWKGATRGKFYKKEKRKT